MIGMNLVTPNDNSYADDFGNANWSTVQNLGIRPTTDGSSVTTGILLHAHGVRLNNLHVNGVGTCVDAAAIDNAYNVNTSLWEITAVTASTMMPMGRSMVARGSPDHARLSRLCTIVASE